MEPVSSTSSCSSLKIVAQWPARAQLADEPGLAFEVDLHFVICAELVAGKHPDRLTEHLRTGLADQHGRSHCGSAVIARLAGLVEVDTTKAHHGAVCHFDAAESMLAAQLDTAAEMGESAAHTALRIRGVGQSAKCPRLRLRRSRAPRIGEPAFVLLATGVYLAEREEDVATKMMDASKLGNEIVALGMCLCGCEELDCFVKTLGNPQAFGQTDLRLAQTDVVGSAGNRLPVERDRGADVAKVALQLAFKALERVTLSLFPRDLEATGDETKRRLGLIRRTLRCRRVQIGPRRPRILRTIEMLGV